MSFVISRVRVKQLDTHLPAEILVSLLTSSGAITTKDQHIKHTTKKKNVLTRWRIENAVKLCTVSRASTRQTDKRAKSEITNTKNNTTTTRQQPTNGKDQNHLALSCSHPLSRLDNRSTKKQASRDEPFATVRKVSLDELLSPSKRHR